VPSFLFIIPLTPDEFLSRERDILRTVCLNALRQQSYDCWQALLIGKSQLPVNDRRFVVLEKEGLKVHKIQWAANFIRSEKWEHDYIVRLDDDDIFNPHQLSKIRNMEFDVFVDKYHYFFDYKSSCVSRQVRYWFPNTCIQKSMHALAPYGNIEHRHWLGINEHVSVLENDHSAIHKYYWNKRVVFTSRKNPMYLRVIHDNSITAHAGADKAKYFSTFGLWNQPIPRPFVKVLESLVKDKEECKQKASLPAHLMNSIRELNASLNYRKKVFKS